MRLSSSNSLSNGISGDYSQILKSDQFEACQIVKIANQGRQQDSSSGLMSKRTRLLIETEVTKIGWKEDQVCIASNGQMGP